MSVKKPLMAPRRKITKSEAKVRFKARRPCTKAVCKPCCYAFISLAALIGLMAIVVVLVSIFPLPLDTFKRWVVSDETQIKATPRLVPCSELKVTEMWTASFPHLTSEAEVRVLDVNQDGIEDVMMGFGAGVVDDPKLSPEVFCQMYFGMPPPCQGGVIAINGRNGDILWKRYLPHTVFSLHCSADVNNDNVTDCLVTGKAGIFTVINTKDGSAIWSFVDNSAEKSLIMDVYFGNFIPDQNEDGISDILTAHTSQKGTSRVGHLLLVSGKTGEELRKVSLPNGTETFYTPQIFSPNNNGNYTVLFGTGGPTTPGNLSVVDLSDLLLHSENMTITTLYEGRYKGVMSPAVLTDITGDGSVDIVASVINSTILAVDGRTFKQIWNYTLDNSESFGTPTPAYFNYDNVTDFLVRVQVGPGFPTYYYSQTFIIDGRTGKTIYSEPMVSSMGSQAEALTLSMEQYGFDHYLFSNLDCRGYENSKDKFGFIPGEDVRHYSRADLCKLRFNTTTGVTVHALSQFNQPPGIVIYNSDKHAALEYNNTGKLKDMLTAYLKAHPDTIQHSDVKELQSNTQNYKPNGDTFKSTRYEDGSNFRHKDNGNVLLQQFGSESEKRPDGMEQIGQKFVPDYYQNMDNWQSELSPFEPEDNFEGDYNGYLENPETNPGPYDPSKPLWKNTADNLNHRNPRSKTKASTAIPTKDPTTQTPIDYNIYDYQNVQKSRSKLMQDLNSSPTEILKQTYFKNLERQLRKSRFQQRDIESEADKVKENEQIKAAIEEKKKELANTSESLWDLETEKEEEDRKNGYWRGKREVNSNSSTAVYGIPRVTSTGAVISSINSTRNTIDIILVTYWSKPKSSAKILLEQDIDCIIRKLNSTKNIGDRMEETYMNECLEARGIHSTKGAISKKSDAFANPQQPSDFSLGQMTVYRLQLECVCHRVTNKGERCSQFLKSDQRWPMFLGPLGDGTTLKVKT